MRERWQQRAARGIIAALIGLVTVLTVLGLVLTARGEAFVLMLLFGASALASLGAAVGLLYIGAERAARTGNEQKFRELLDATRESIVIHRGFKKLYANDAFESSFGRDEEAWTRLFTPERRSLFEGRFRDTLQTGVTARYRREEVVTPGQPTWVDLLTRRMEWEGRPALQSNLLDVTAQVKAEEAATAQQSAETEARNKSQMLANMSHELRTPMTGVLGMADLLFHTQLDPQQHRLLTGLRSSADLLLTLVDDVLDFSRLEADVVRLADVDFDPRRAVDTVVQLLEPKSRPKGIELRQQVDDSVPRALRGDPVRLQQILFNLVGNAIKFTDVGHVELRLSARVEGGYAQLHCEIEDTGAGIAPERLPQLFQRWDQGDEGTRARFGGNGLGLAISQRLTRLMGGDIDVRSQLDAGSTFFVGLRLAVGELSAIEAAKAKLLPLGWAQGRSLLLAEDEEVNRSMLTMLMEGEGFRVVAVADGAQAVEAAQREAFDLVLLDMHMPVKSGAEAAAEIAGSSSSDGVRPRIIGLTADADPEHKARYQSVGVEALLTKPFDRNDFAKLAHEMLGGAPSTVAAGGSKATRAAPELNSAALVCEDRLRHLLAHLGRERLDRLAEQFRSRARDELGRVEEALLGGSADQISEASHRLAGFAANMGADRLALEARTLHDQPNLDGESERTRRLDRLQRCLEDTLDEMDARLTQPRHERQ